MLKLALIWFVLLTISAVLLAIGLVGLMVVHAVRFLKKHLDRPIDDFIPSGSLRLAPAAEMESAAP